MDEALSQASLVGLGGVSIGGLATSLGLSKSGLFAHFGSKETLQLAVLEKVVDRFTERVIRPGLRPGSGKTKLERLFDGWMKWGQNRDYPGGCPLLAASIEFDDQPGPLCDYIVQQQSLWMSLLSNLAERAVREGDFHKTLHPRQFAFEMNAIGLGCSFGISLFRDPQSTKLAHSAFQRLLRDAQPK